MKHTQLINSLHKLRLHQMATDYSEIARQCERDGKTFEQYLGILAEVEIEAKHDAKTRQLLKAAKLPRGKSLDDYDYDCRDGVTLPQINKITTGEFLREGANLVLYGGFGVGKSHLAEGITKALCENGFRCKFMNVQDQINELAQAQKDLNLARYLKKLDKFDLLALDELGYLPCGKDEADLFFQLISHRYERKSLMITTNLTFSEWDQVFKSELTTMGAVDRMIHKCETINVKGPSWRAEEAKKRAARNNELEKPININ